MPVDDVLEGVSDAPISGDGVNPASSARIVLQGVIPFVLGVIGGAYLAFAFGWLPLVVGAILVGVGWARGRNLVLMSLGLGLALAGVWGLVQYLSATSSI